MLARKRLGEMLVEEGALDETQLCAALGHQRQWGGKLGQTLVELKLVPEPVVLRALSRRLDCEVVQLERLASGPELDAALKLVPADLARRHGALPVASDRTTITVAMADPANVAALDEISFSTGRRVKPLLAASRDVERAVSRFYGAAYAGDSIEVDFDVHAADDGMPVYDSSAAKFQERFYRSALREWSSDGSAAAPPSPAPPRLVREAATPAPVHAVPSAPHAAAAPAQARSALGEALERMARGAHVDALPVSALVAAVTRALVRRGLVTEAEILGELWRARGGKAAG